MMGLYNIPAGLRDLSIVRFTCMKASKSIRVAAAYRAHNEDFPRRRYSKREKRKVKL